MIQDAGSDPPSSPPSGFDPLERPAAELAAPLITAQAVRPGESLGPYRIVREVGHGGMAVVYLAEDPRHGRQVALKVMTAAVAASVDRQRFVKEIQVAARLIHPHILPVFDSGESEGRLWYAMPYVAGETLRHRLAREPQLPIAEAVEIARQVASALDYAHRQGVVHRDIKPGNILLPQGRAVLADFGLARAITILGEEKLTKTGIALGTAAYMSPEQAAGAKVDARSDIYALGCVLFEMLSGGPPFTGASSQAVLARHAVDPVPSLRTVRATVSPSLEKVVVKALAKVPADRYSTVEQFHEALRQIDLTEVQPVRSRRRWGLGLAGAGLALLIIAGLSWRLLPASRRELDPGRVMVYPLVAPSSFTPRTIGEDVATMIGNALDGNGQLRWIDGWSLLKPEQREDIRTLSLGAARALARDKRCAYYVTGRLVVQGDSVEVLLNLNDVRGDSIIARGKSSGSIREAWRAGLRAVNDVLPRLIPGAPGDLVTEWKDRDPGAIASFLLGEAAFRRVHLGEALDHYRSAVEADSSFGLAAIRGAQAATWNHRPTEAGSLIQVAIRQRLPPRYQHFARGYAAYLSGRADSAAVEFRRAIALDPDMAVAWVQLGEVYTHLLPVDGDLDSLARESFEQARRLDSTDNGVLLHLIESRLRKGDTKGAAPLIHDFLAAGPDTTLAAQIRVMQACVQRGAEETDWKSIAKTQTLALLSAGNALKGAGSQLPCAMLAFSTVIDGDTTSAGDLRWFALLVLQSGLLAQGRTSEAIAQVDSPIMRGDGASMYLLDAPVYPMLAERARQVARGYQRECGPEYRRCDNPVRLWELGVWEAQEGRAAVADAVARELATRAPRPGLPREKHVIPILAQSVAAHAALARGDTAAAETMFLAALREPVPGELLSWDVASPRGLDRLRLAQLLVARGQFQRAVEIANVFESAWPSIHLLYLPASLRLRAEAASAMGNAALAAHFRSRLAALAGNRVVAVQ
jgi:serine/threonine protein kinase/tetratricopeptide (TPR) repeat protein